ncbi:hypothetical protein TWF718_003333 [Orbilia javanica]|uniref:Uncharacterized protein n=1 Tax=Orbilia javanica TaxID=47235 RepID=A0AAN8R9Z7_9PEZI
MSRDLLGEFGDFQSGGNSGNNGSNTTFSTPSYSHSHHHHHHQSSGQDQQGGGNINDLLGLFGSSPAPAPAPPSNNNINISNNVNYNNYNNNVNNQSTTLFSTSPNHTAYDFNNDAAFDDDFGDFAVEPLPSTNPTFGPFSNSSPPLKPTSTLPPSSSSYYLQKPEILKKNIEIQEDEDFGTFISTPRVPTPPPTFSLSSTITNSNYSHPSHPPPPLHTLLPFLTTQLLTPLPFLTRLKPLSYPAKQRLLTSPKVKNYFMAVILISHVVGRIIAGKKARARRSYKGVKSIDGGNGKKNDGLKDDREVAECVREYNEIVGSLRAVVRGMGVVVVELSIDMAISTSTSTAASASGNAGKGGNLKKKKTVANATAAAGEFCWLCGLSPLDKVVKLKEDEIQLGRDIDGKEKWTAGWGHRGCKNWWDECGGRFKP